jgi:hypothetical protein
VNGIITIPKPFGDMIARTGKPTDECDANTSAEVKKYMLTHILSHFKQYQPKFALYKQLSFQTQNDES